ncbi:hypothetical protein FAZ95_28125 [Trinickia violacea]|uniref:Uncharacterized protein n=1 Tax=Trinickia violacea TaxID=2571746 RepID=A0A4P8IV18_9BURK|nr:hypothetical protein [Trinickia violacea]QCP52972.1 hypothetical protein FAZ95_28125 [Trinickia violacea]
MVANIKSLPDRHQYSNDREGEELASKFTPRMAAVHPKRAAQFARWRPAATGREHAFAENAT